MTDTTRLGGFLQSCRQQSGLNVADIARQLHIDPTLVTALEADDFSPFADEAGLRELLTSYAELVDLAPSAVLRLYERQAQLRLQDTALSADTATAARDAASADAVDVAAGATTTPRLYQRKRKLPIIPFLVAVPLILGVAYLLWSAATPKPRRESAGVPAVPASGVSLAVLPAEGAMVRVLAETTVVLTVAIDNHPAEEFTLLGGEAMRWQARRRVALTLDPPQAKLEVNNRPVDFGGARQITLRSQEPGS